MFADFQQCYGLCLWDFRLNADETGKQVERAAILAYQLPADSRTRAKLAPAGAHGEDALLLRAIEHDLRVWHWANTEDAKDETTRPDPLLLDGEEDALERRRARQIDEAPEIARQLGLSF